MNENNWKGRIKSVLNTCQDEVIRTTEIGKRMLKASKMNTELKETYIELGKLARQELDKELLDWKNQDASNLLEKIKEYEKSLEDIEGEVQDIKSTDS